MPKPSIYTVGGTVQAGGGLYLPRKADEELLKLCRDGTFAYVLTSRQLGKSSLMVRTAEQLAEKGTRSVIIDLTQLGVQVTAEAWYLGLLTTITDELALKIDVIGWWRARADFGVTKRLTDFFHDVVLAQIKDPMVIFVDEIDSTLSLDFTDDFYAAVRYFYNARAQSPEFQRLTFVLLGVATPGDLIIDPHRTPFNIGQPVHVTDFTYEEALPLAKGLELPVDQARQVLQWVMKWTGGHPYLTQRLCRAIFEQFRRDWTEAEVDRTVAMTFFGRMSEEDNNLQFVRDMLTRRAPNKLAVISAYKDIRLGRTSVRDEEQSPIKSHLKLSGVVKRENGKLQVRNPIYREVFDRRWIQEHWPVSWWATIPPSVKIAASLVALFLAASAILLALYAQEQTKAVNNEKLLAQEQEARRLEADSLLQLANKARADAEAGQKKAVEEKLKADRLAKAEANARADAQAASKRAVQQAELAKKNAAEADSAKQEALKNLREVERRRRIDIARALAIQAPQEQQLGNEELAMLLSRQAFLLNKNSKGPIESETYQSLLKTLNGAGGPIPFRGHKFAVKAVAFHPDSQIVASGSEDGTIRLWNLRQPDMNPMELLGHTAGVRAVAFSPDGKWLASGSEDRTLRLWELRENNYSSVSLNAHTDWVMAVAFSPDGNHLTSGGADNSVQLWDLRQTPPTSKPLPNQVNRVRCVAFSPDGQTLAAACDDGNIRLWDLRQTDREPNVLPGHKGNVNAVAFSPDGQTLASGGNDRTVRLWNRSTSGDSATVLRSHEGYVNTVQFSNDGQTLASGSHDGNVLLWNWRQRTDSPILTLANGSWVWSVTFSRDGQTLAAGCDDRTVRLWLTQAELLAEKVCTRVRRNMSPQEWEKFVGKDIQYENTCPSLPAGKKSAQTEASSSAKR